MTNGNRTQRRGKQRTTPVATAMVDRGYRGGQGRRAAEVILPGTPLPRAEEAPRQRQHRPGQQRTGMEPAIWPRKSDFRLARHWLQGRQRDAIDRLMAPCAWNLRQWRTACLWFEFQRPLWLLWTRTEAWQRPEMIRVKLCLPIPSYTN